MTITMKKGFVWLLLLAGCARLMGQAALEREGVPVDDKNDVRAFLKLWNEILRRVPSPNPEQKAE